MRSVDLTFDEIVERAARERWDMPRLVGALNALPEPERSRAKAITLAAIADDLRSKARWRRRRLARMK